MQLIRQIFRYLGERQTPTVRFLHVTILLLVLLQLLVSDFIGFSESGAIIDHGTEFYATWLHISLGLTLLPITLLFVFIELRSHGFRAFFPYFFGDSAQLKEDIEQIRKRRLPEPEPGGLAVIVQGLGFIALLLVLCSGATWFTLWTLQSPWAHAGKEVHELMTGLIIAYVIGHGGMGALHITLHLLKGGKKGGAIGPEPR